MTAQAVTDEQIGQFYRRIRALEERLGKSLSFDQVMRTLQQIHDGRVEEVDVRMCVRENNGVYIVPGFDASDQEKYLTLGSFLEANPYLTVRSSLKGMFNGLLSTQIAPGSKRRWFSCGVTRSVEHDQVARDLESLDLILFQERDVADLVARVAECVWIQCEEEEIDGSNRFFQASKPCFFYVERDGYMSVLELQHHGEGWLLSVTASHALASEGSQVYYPWS